MADRDYVQKAQAKFPVKILPRGQAKCYRDTDLVRAHHTIVDARHTAKNQAQMGILQYGIGHTFSLNDLYRLVQIP